MMRRTGLGAAGQRLLPEIRGRRRFGGVRKFRRRGQLDRGRSLGDLGRFRGCSRFRDGGRLVRVCVEFGPLSRFRLDPAAIRPIGVIIRSRLCGVSPGPK